MQIWFSVTGANRDRECVLEGWGVKQLKEWERTGEKAVKKGRQPEFQRHKWALASDVVCGCYGHSLICMCITSITYNILILIETDFYQIVN